MTRQIGNAKLFPIGLGGMPMSIEGRPDEAQAIRTIHAALNAGVNFIDTADSYHLHADEVGHNESLIAKALQQYGGMTDDVLVATKAGHLRPGDGTWTQDGSPKHVKEAAKASAKRLGVEAIGLFQFHRPDPKVPWADSIGAVAELLDEGWILMAGVSNANPEQIKQADEILSDRLVSVQNQFSPAFVSSYPEMELCEEMSIAFLPWSPLGGIRGAKDVGGTFPVFQEVADARGVSPQQITLAWELALSPFVIPIPGASRPESIEDSVKAAEIALSEDEVAALSAVLKG